MLGLLFLSNHSDMDTGVTSATTTNPVSNQVRQIQKTTNHSAEFYNTFTILGGDDDISSLWIEQHLIIELYNTIISRSV